MTAREGSQRRWRDRLRSVLPLVTWLATLVVAIALFTRLGSGPLAAPPVTDPGGWGRWAADREPVVATVALLRLLVLALAWYLVGVTTIGAVARVARLAALVRVADALSVPAVRRVLQTSLGVGLATAVVAASAPGVAPRPVGIATAGAASSSTPTMQALPDATATVDVDDTPPAMQPLADPTGPAPAGGPPPPGMHPLPPAPATPSPTTTPEPTTAPDPIPTADPTPVDTREDVAAGADADGTTWTVRTGDHLWSIAETHLRETLGQVPDDRVVADYWRRLVEANRGRLVDPDDADLVVPGQRFVLPDVEVES